LGYDNANVFHRIVTDRLRIILFIFQLMHLDQCQGNKFQNSITSAVAIAQAASMTTGIRVQISFRGTDSLIPEEKKKQLRYMHMIQHMIK
jgi:hypothetical protein